MPKDFVQKAFHIWISQNQNRFRHPPTQIRYIQGHVEFLFSGIIHEISAVINKYGCNVAFTYQNKVWDFLICFDVSVERDAEGYYCGQCIVMDERFHSRADLLADHVFEPLLEWANERLNDNVLAQICQLENGGGTWVNLVSKEQMESGLNDEHSSVREVFPFSRISVVKS